MAQPLPSPPPNWPLQALLRDMGVTEKELRSILRDGAEEAERLIPKLIEQNTTGATLKAAQTAIILREVRSLMSAMWGDIGASVRDGVKRTVMTAHQGEDILFKFLGTKATEVMKAALAQQARAGVEAVLAKAYNGIPLSTQVYRTQALSFGLVHKRVNNGLILGHSAQRIAKDVRDLISPDVAGGVSYAAMRLARTEINNAYKTAQEQRYKDEPWTSGMRWHLSRSHPVPDKCDEYAAHGVYPFGERPLSHPNCLCYMTPEQVSEDEFIEHFLTGEYDEYLDELAPSAAPLVQKAIAPERSQPKRPEPLPLTIVPRDKWWPMGKSWQASTDRAERAGALWSETFAGLGAVRQAMRNIRDGVEPWYKGVPGNHRTLQLTYMGIEDDNGEPTVYTEDSMKADVLNAALYMLGRLDRAPKHKKKLYRGLRMDKAKIWQVGDTFTQDFASWTEERDWASVYAMTEDNSTGHVGDSAVVVILQGEKRSADIDDVLASGQRGSKEHIAGGTYRVVRVSKAGRYINVTVEQIDAD